VRPVHSVKVPHAHQGRPEVSRDILEFVKNLHGLGQWPVVSGQKSVFRTFSLTTEHQPLTTEIQISNSSFNPS
jgi:hypothetical protein